MIISASRRTDIPAFYSEWFLNRIKEQVVLVRNPLNPYQISKISLSPDLVDGIVFWTKNPIPMIDRLEYLQDYVYYFQFTLTSYGRDVEPCVPSKSRIILPAFQNLSRRVGKSRVIWRYDPILFNDKYTMDYHIQYFKILASELGNYTEKCIVSFLDFYKKTQRNLKLLAIKIPSYNEKIELLQQFSDIACSSGLQLETCAENLDLECFGIKRSHCIDKERLERLGKYHLEVGKDKNQRRECGCAESIDIGMYNSCNHGCLYCYANTSPKMVRQNRALHHPDSPLLFGKIGDKDIIKERKVKSYRNNQLIF